MEKKKTYAIDTLMQPFVRIVRQEKSAGVMLGIGVVLALFLANSPWSEYYFGILEYKLGIGFNDELYLNYSIHDWINNGLMSIFFFIVGLELKREMIDGELSKPKKAILPIFAAIGGMIIPLAIYLLFNQSGPERHGWGIPMATDIAFAIGVLYFLGDRVPASLKVFLTALAIIDDIGAVLVIAFFYSSDLSLTYLGLGFGILGVIYLLNKMGMRNMLVYAVLGIGGVWFAFLESGVSPTIAAVLVAFTIPADMRVNRKEFVSLLGSTMDSLMKSEGDDVGTLSEEKLGHIREINRYTNFLTPPLQALEQKMAVFVAFFVVPVFALANAGVDLRMDLSLLFSTNIVEGVALGLLVGKVVGIVGFTMLLVKFNVASFPAGMNIKNLLGLSLLAAIGFTMSLFIAMMAFTEEEHIIQAKVGIFVASLVAGTAGYFWLNYLGKKDERKRAKEGK
ncbi:MAG TPA: Na+/H+ antiporter NhaA [Flavobacteriaceae bacterium]|nr:Na+/H+ antiporter NhaA [Flavobacteriaceae bacterium]